MTAGLSCAVEGTGFFSPVAGMTARAANSNRELNDHLTNCWMPVREQQVRDASKL